MPLIPVGAAADYGAQMKKYALVFAASYLLITVATALLAEAFEFRNGVSFNPAATMAASFLAAWRFTKDFRRRPTTEEKKSYTLMALGAAWVTSLMLVLAAFFFLLPPEQTQQIHNAVMSEIFVGVVAAGFFVISVFYYVVIRWSFSWYANVSCRA